jgi:phage tail protein X
MAPKPKAEIARSHLEKARVEADQKDLADAVQWSFASLEAVIDAVSEAHGIADLPDFFPDHIWGERLSDDQQALGRNLSGDLMAIVKQIEERARDANALALILAGSTALGRRTAVSDLDFHVIGDQRLDLTVLPVDIEIYRDAKRRFGEKLEEGDDFAHWSVRFGRIVFDRGGVIREAAEEVAGRDLWPDPDRKMRQAGEALRDEIPAQLQERGFGVLADDLRATIHGRPDVIELQEALKRARQPKRSSLVAV